MKKQITLCLLCAMLFQLAACSEKIDETIQPEQNPGNESVQSGTTVDETTPEETKRFDMSWDGRSYVIYGNNAENDHFRNFEFYAEGITGEKLNDEIYKRNENVAKLYDIKLDHNVLEGSDDDNADFIRQLIATNEGVDLTCLRTTRIGSLAAEGLFCNLNEFEYVDFSQPWWNQNINETLSIDNKLYFTSSDYLLHDKFRTYIVYYNEDMANEYQMGDLQTIAEEGGWTIDIMDSLGRQVARDLDNNSKYDANDLWSVCGGAYKDTAMFTFAMGNKILDKDEEGNIYISMGEERMFNSIDKVLSLFTKNISHFPEDLQYISDVPDFWTYSADIFNNGKALFRSSILGVLKQASEKCNFTYKILPMPKYDEEQESYITQPDDIALFMAVPRSTADSDFSGFMLEVMSEESSKTTAPLYYELMTSTRYAPDPRSAALLDVIMDGVDYDIGFIYNIGELRDILTNWIPERRQNALAGRLRVKQTKAETAIEELIAQYDKLD